MPYYNMPNALDAFVKEMGAVQASWRESRYTWGKYVINVFWEDEQWDIDLYHHELIEPYSSYNIELGSNITKKTSNNVLQTMLHKCLRENKT